MIVLSVPQLALFRMSGSSHKVRVGPPRIETFLRAPPSAKPTHVPSGDRNGAAAFSVPASAGKLVINANTSDPGPKQAFEELVERFEAANPDIDVQLNIFDHEGFKTTVRNFLTSQSPDVITWFAGNRMKAFVDRDLLDDVSDIWADNNLSESMASSLPALTIDGRIEVRLR